MTAYTWNTLQTAVATALVQQPYTAPPADFQSQFPQATSYAEGEITRDLVLLNTRKQLPAGSTTSGSNIYSANAIVIPPLLQPPLQTPVATVEGVSLVQANVSYAYEKASLDFINLTWPNANQSLSPAAAQWSGRYWAMVDDNYYLIAPTPDAAYLIQMTALLTPVPMSPSNQFTYIGNVYGDLMLAATMVWMNGGLLRNFGAASDEPQAAVSWRGVYQQLLPGAIAEEKRRRGLAPDVAAPIAASERG